MSRDTMLPSACVYFRASIILQSQGVVSFCVLCALRTIGTHVWLFELLVSIVATLLET